MRVAGKTRIGTIREELSKTQTDRALESMLAFVGPVGQKKPKKAFTVSKKQREAAFAGARARSASGLWSDAGAREIVGLYAVLHEDVYGFAPLDLATGVAFAAAAVRAAHVGREHFQGNVESFVEFILWAWIEERRTEQWRRENHRGGGVLGWRRLFNETLITKFRLDKERRGV